MAFWFSMTARNSTSVGLTGKKSRITDRKEKLARKSWDYSINLIHPRNIISNGYACNRPAGSKFSLISTWNYWNDVTSVKVSRVVKIYRRSPFPAEDYSYFSQWLILSSIIGMTLESYVVSWSVLICQLPDSEDVSTPSDCQLPCSNYLSAQKQPLSQRVPVFCASHCDKRNL